MDRAQRIQSARPCPLWFFDRTKERDEVRCDHVLRIARNFEELGV